MKINSLKEVFYCMRAKELDGTYTKFKHYYFFILSWFLPVYLIDLVLSYGFTLKYPRHFYDYFLILFSLIISLFITPIIPKTIN